MVYRKFTPVSNHLRANVGLMAHIVLGSPKKNCDGIGICRIERAVPHEVSTTLNKCCTAKALLTSKDSKLVFYFVKHSLPSCVRNKQFSRDHFPIDSESILPNDIALSLGFKRGTYIAKGVYRFIDLGLHLCLLVDTKCLHRQSANWQ